MDWTALGGALTLLLGGVGAVLMKFKPWKTAAKAEAAANDAEATVINTLRAEFERQAEKVSVCERRITELESRCDRQARRIWQLEHELARHGIEIPAEPKWAQTN
jgi:predicted RNase H-like nuclease (RuvC/YqgF family)